MIVGEAGRIDEREERRAVEEKEERGGQKRRRSDMCACEASRQFRRSLSAKRHAREMRGAIENRISRESHGFAVSSLFRDTLRAEREKRAAEIYCVSRVANSAKNVCGCRK